MHTHGGKARWAEFCRTLMGDATQTEAAERTGIPQATISRFLSGRRLPTASHAITFARAYDVNPVEAMVAAGLITDDEANMPRTTARDLTVVPTGRLIRELARRDRETEVAS